MKILKVLPVLVLLAASGCLKLDETLTIEKNGSGNIELTYIIPEQTVAQMKSMFKLRDQMDLITGQSAPQTKEEIFQRLFFDPAEERIRQQLKRYEPFGITIDTLKVETRSSARNVNLKVLFADLARLAKTDFFPEHGFTLARNKDGTYTFYRASEPNGSQENIGSEAAGLLTPVLNGFRAALKINTPGKIIETNASRKTLYNAAWIFEFDKDPNAMTALQRQNMKIVFDGKDLNLPEVRQIAAAPRKTTVNQKTVNKLTASPGSSLPRH